MSLAYIVSWLLAIWVGTALYAAVSPIRLRGWIFSALGYGGILGIILCGALTALSARSDTSNAWMHAAPWLAAIAVLASIVAWRRGTPMKMPLRTPANGPRDVSPRLWVRLGLAGLLISIALRAAIAAREVWLRPLYPWDAWSAWAVKAKTWFLLGHFVPYVSMPDWLQAMGAEVYTGVAWHYPDALAWIDVWFASAAGGWIEPLINLPWLVVWLGVLCSHYGQWRALDLGRDRAMLGIYVLGSLPLLTVHAAIAGYADLWVGALFGLGLLAWMRWLQQRDSGQLLLALFCAAILPWLKLEGGVWALCFFAAIGFGALPTRWRWACLAVGLVAFVALFGFGGAKALVGHWGAAAGPLALLMAPAWHADAATGIARTLFAQPNWHLLWWLAPLLLIWRWRELAIRDWLWLPALLILGCIGLLLFLFLFTDASSWAKSFTAINRLVLQLTPATVSLLVMLLRDAQLPAEPVRGTAPTPGLRSDPG